MFTKELIVFGFLAIAEIHAAPHRTARSVGLVPLGSDDAQLINQQAQPGVDFPIYASIPLTSFDCLKTNLQPEVYYADPETNCQVFHLCTSSGIKESFLCPNYTIFNDQSQVCEWWHQVQCNAVASQTTFTQTVPIIASNNIVTIDNNAANDAFLTTSVAQSPVILPSNNNINTVTTLTNTNVAPITTLTTSNNIANAGSTLLSSSNAVPINVQSSHFGEIDKHTPAGAQWVIPLILVPSHDSAIHQSGQNFISANQFAAQETAPVRTAAASKIVDAVLVNNNIAATNNLQSQQNVVSAPVVEASKVTGTAHIIPVQTGVGAQSVITNQVPVQTTTTIKEVPTWPASSNAVQTTYFTEIRRPNFYKPATVVTATNAVSTWNQQLPSAQIVKTNVHTAPVVTTIQQTPVVVSDTTTIEDTIAPVQVAAVPSFQTSSAAAHNVQTWSQEIPSAQIINTVSAPVVTTVQQTPVVVSDTTTIQDTIAPAQVATVAAVPTSEVVVQSTQLGAGLQSASTGGSGWGSSSSAQSFAAPLGTGLQSAVSSNSGWGSGSAAGDYGSFYGASPSVAGGGLSVLSSLPFGQLIAAPFLANPMFAGLNGMASGITQRFLLPTLGMLG